MLVLVRYGETETSLAKRFSGQNPGPLTQDGIDLANQYGEGLAGVMFDLCYAAPKTAAMDTAEAVGRNRILCAFPSALNEPSAGTYEGILFSNLKKELPPRQYRLWDRDFFVAPPSGESMADASERAFAWFEEHVEGPFKANPALNILIVTGPTMMKLLLGRLQQLEETDVVALQPLDCPYSFDRIP